MCNTPVMCVQTRAVYSSQSFRMRPYSPTVSRGLFDPRVLFSLPDAFLLPCQSVPTVKMNVMKSIPPPPPIQTYPCMLYSTQRNYTPLTRLTDVLLYWSLDIAIKRNVTRFSRSSHVVSINCTRHNHFWRAHRRSTTQKIIRFLWNRKAQYHINL